MAQVNNYVMDRLPRNLQQRTIATGIREGSVEILLLSCSVMTECFDWCAVVHRKVNIYISIHTFAPSLWAALSIVRSL